MSPTGDEQAIDSVWGFQHWAVVTWPQEAQTGYEAGDADNPWGGNDAGTTQGADIKNFFFCSLINAAIIGVWGTVVSRSAQAGMAHFLCDWDICRGVLCKKKNRIK